MLAAFWSILENNLRNLKPLRRVKGGAMAMATAIVKACDNHKNNTKSPLKNKLGFWRNEQDKRRQARIWAHKEFTENAYSITWITPPKVSTTETTHEQVFE